MSAEWEPGTPQGSPGRYSAVILRRRGWGTVNRELCPHAHRYRATADECARRSVRRKRGTR